MLCVWCSRQLGALKASLVRVSRRALASLLRLATCYSVLATWYQFLFFSNSPQKRGAKKNGAIHSDFFENYFSVKIYVETHSAWYIALGSVANKCCKSQHAKASYPSTPESAAPDSSEKGISCDCSAEKGAGERIQQTITSYESIFSEVCTNSGFLWRCEMRYSRLVRAG